MAPATAARRLEAMAEAMTMAEAMLEAGARVGRKLTPPSQHGYLFRVSTSYYILPPSVGPRVLAELGA